MSWDVEFTAVVSIANPIPALRHLENRVTECLAVAQRRLKEEPNATSETANIDHAFQLSHEELGKVDAAIRRFAEDKIGQEPDSNDWESHYFFLQRKSENREYSPLHWYPVVESYINTLEWVRCSIVYVLSICDHNGNSVEIRNFGDITMGSVFRNIQNSTIINDATISDSFNALQENGNAELAELLISIGDIVARSNDQIAATLYEKLAEELKKKQPDTGFLKSCWKGILAIVPNVATLATAAEKLFGFVKS